MSNPGEMNDPDAREPEVCVSEPLIPGLSFITNNIKHREAGGSRINPLAFPVFTQASTVISMTTSFGIVCIFLFACFF